MMISYVAGFLFSEDLNSVVLVLKNRPEWQKGLFNGVGGKVEDSDSSPAAAMSREFSEETGITISEENWTEFVHLSRPGVYEVHFFHATSNLAYSAWMTESEPIILANPDSLPANSVHNLNWLIPMALDDSLEGVVEILDTKGN